MSNNNNNIILRESGDEESFHIVENENTNQIIVPITKNYLPPFDYFHEILKSPKCSVAPMVDASELPFRMLCRKYGAHMAWSPMLHSKLFVKQIKYPSRFFTTCPEDRPLAIQFCANDPEYLLQAAKRVEGECDLIDINFGCPQNIAKRGNYGAFLDNQWDTIFSLVNTLYKNLSVPVSCKIRVFKDREKTLRYAKMIQSAGCQLLSVHGRTKEQKGQSTGLADWSYIKMIKEELSIPVIANGNIQKLEDVDECLRATGADGVMSAEALLANPALFSGLDVPACTLSLEYLSFCKLYPVEMPIVRGHLFKIMKKLFDIFPEQRERLGLSDSFAEAEEVIKTVEMFLETPSLYDLTPKNVKKKKLQDSSPSEAAEEYDEVDCGCLFD